MKVAKKVTWAIIALLPVAVMVAGVIGNLGNTSGMDLVPLGELSISVSPDGLYSVSVTPDSWGDYILTPFYQKPVGGLYGALAGFALYLDANAGVPASVPLLCSLVILFHLAIVELAEVLVDLFLFIPRKCSEIFR